jgi:putative SOS response-associated peptidase YedK
MCGRYYRTGDKQAIAEHFASELATDEPFPPGCNIAPSKIQPIILKACDTGARKFTGLRWGLVGFWPHWPRPKTHYLQCSRRQPRAQRPLARPAA